MRPLTFFNIPKLHEYLGPCLRIRTAVQRRELPGLNFSDVVSRLHCTPIIEEDER